MLERKGKSFSLLEVVFVVAIFLLVIGAVISVVGMGYKNLMKNEAHWKASILAQNFLEERSVIRDNNILKWLQSPRGVDDVMADEAVFVNINPTACPSSWPTDYQIIKHYNYSMEETPPYFFELGYKCSTLYPGVFIAQVTWNQFNRNFDIQTRQFLKNTSGAIH